MYEYLFTCHEPEGTRVRFVRPLEPGDISRVYNSIRASLLARGRELPPELALREFGRLDKLYWVVDTVGLLIASAAGDVHIFFWDKRLRGREGLCKSMAQVVMNFYERDDVWTKIPDSERAVIAFAERVGFQQELADGGFVTLRLRRQHGS